MRTKILFKMVSDGVTSKSFEAFGDFENNLLTFTDFEDERYLFHFVDESVIMKRKGGNPLRMTFKLNQMTTASISYAHQTFDIMLRTKLLVSTTNHLEIHYEISDGSNAISNHILFVEWKV